MDVPKVVVWLPFDEDLERLKKDLSSNQHILVAESEDEVRAAICPNKPQLLVVGNREEDISFVLSMKELNPELNAVQFGLPYIPGQPKPPYDMLMTRAHPQLSYAGAFKDMIREFEAQHIARMRGSSPPSS